MDVLQVIEDYGLSIRHIPHKIVDLHNIRHFRDGDERFYSEVYKGEMCRRTTIHRYAGYWMCRQVISTSATVTWSAEHHFLAPTLEESLALFLATNPEKELK